MTQPLSLNEYQSRAAETAIYPGKGTPLGLIYCALKMAGEAGEVSEKVGKAIREDGVMRVGIAFGVPFHHGGTDMHAFSEERIDGLKAELGDVLWYVAAAAKEIGCDLSDIAQANLDKLASRQARGVLDGSGDNR